MVGQDSKPPACLAPRGNRKCSTLHAKIFSLKTKKQNQMLPAAIEKNQLFFPVNSLWFL